MRKTKDKYIFRIPDSLHKKIIEDLSREHEFAFERIGFLHTNSKKLSDGTTLILATHYKPVDDENYIEDRTVGAKINSAAIRAAMQEALDSKAGCFHIHLHDHYGKPTPSTTDETGGIPEIIKSFIAVQPDQNHGVIILSKDSLYLSVRNKHSNKFICPDQATVTGYPMHLQFPYNDSIRSSIRFSRQSFLGNKSENLFENIRVGIIGYGGGGSHIGQQLSHLGIKNIVVFDDDSIEESNLNRLVGGWFSDLKKKTKKVMIAKRAIQKVLPGAVIDAIDGKWQEQPEKLQLCDVIVGCVDSYSERHQLEAECRRYLIPYIDIGMDIYNVNNEHHISGQIILSLPGNPCMKCTGFITEKKLTEEARKYGDVGGPPQVVWSNGVLASTAVGLIVDLVTGWSKRQDRLVYLSYDGNSNLIQQHVRGKYCDGNCIHYPSDIAGPAKLKKV